MKDTLSFDSILKSFSLLKNCIDAPAIFEIYIAGRQSNVLSCLDGAMYASIFPDATYIFSIIAEPIIHCVLVFSNNVLVFLNTSFPLSVRMFKSRAINESLSSFVLFGFIFTLFIIAPFSSP